MCHHSTAVNLQCTQIAGSPKRIYFCATKGGGLFRFFHRRKVGDLHYEVNPFHSETQSIALPQSSPALSSSGFFELWVNIEGIKVPHNAVAIVNICSSYRTGGGINEQREQNRAEAASPERANRGWVPFSLSRETLFRKWVMDGTDIDGAR